jgi:signal transduction histidine kinase
MDYLPGIPAENIESIFEKFQTLPSSRNVEGTGLEICKKIIETHNGKIWAESVEEYGSIFLIESTL